MAKTKITVDTEEVDEIIDLYIKENGGIVPELKYKAISDFNAYITSKGYLRANGELFKLYKYNFWGGSYQGEYNYGKQTIIKRNNRNKVQVIGHEFNADVIDIISCVNDLHKKPQELTKALVSIFEKERKKTKELNDELIEANEKLETLRNKVDCLEEGFANLFFQSQSPNNSLNNMMILSKSADSVCYEELKNMFGDTNRFEITTKINDNEITNIVDINKQKKLRELEDDGF